MNNIQTINSYETYYQAGTISSDFEGNIFQKDESLRSRTDHEGYPFRDEETLLAGSDRESGCMQKNLNANEECKRILKQLADASVEKGGEQNISNNLVYSSFSLARRIMNIVLLIIFRNDQEGHSTTSNGLNLPPIPEYINISLLTVGGIQLAYMGCEIMIKSRNAWIATNNPIINQQNRSALKVSIMIRVIFQGGLLGLTGIVTTLNGALNFDINYKSIQIGDLIFATGKWTGFGAILLLGIKNFVDTYYGMKGFITSSRNITAVNDFAQTYFSQVRSIEDQNLHDNLMTRLKTQRIKKVVNSMSTSMSWISIAILLMGMLDLIPLRPAVYIYFSISTMGQLIGMGQEIYERRKEKQLSARQQFLERIEDTNALAREIPAKLDEALQSAVVDDNPSFLRDVIPHIHAKSWSGEGMLTVAAMENTGLQIWKETLK